MAALGDNIVRAVTCDRVREATVRDNTLTKLMEMIAEGVSDNKEAWMGELREFYKHRHHLTVVDGVLMYKSRVIIPRYLRGEVLECLHSAHQGVQGMKARAQDTVFWPGISAAIVDMRNRCRTCDKIAPSNAAEPPITAPSPTYPFEQVVADYCELDGGTFLVMADRYSGWLVLSYYKRRMANTEQLIADMRTWFMTYGAPVELASDGGKTLTSHEFQQFLRNWGVRHRVSSVAFPHSNCRAELAVKTSKRLLRENVNPGGDVNCDKFARAIMQYRNTRLQGLQVSPAQILFGREIRDFCPCPPGGGTIREEWRITAEDREKALARKHCKDLERLGAHTRNLNELEIGQSVCVQNQVGNKPGRWDKTGIIVEKGRGPRQYLVRMDGSGRISLRNRKFLRKCLSFADSPYPALTSPDPAVGVDQGQVRQPVATEPQIPGQDYEGRIEFALPQEHPPVRQQREEQIQPPAPEPVIPAVVPPEERRYPTRNRRKNVRLTGYDVNVEAVEAMTKMTSAEMVRGNRNSDMREQMIRLCDRMKELVETQGEREI